MPGIDEKGIFDTISEYWTVFKNKVSSYFSSEEVPVKKVHEKGKPDDVSGRIYLKDMDENMINPVIKNEMIEEMSQAKTEQYIDAQKQSLHETIEKIAAYKKKYEPYGELQLELLEELLDKMEDSGYKEALREAKENNNDLVSSEEIAELKEKYGIAQMEVEHEKILQQKYNELGLTCSDYQYANKLTGLGDGENNYCIAIQTNAMRLASNQCGESALNQVRDGMGWTCDYASNFFNKAGFADSYDRENSPFVEVDGKWFVKKDENGKPLVNDGDMCIVDGVHCIRFNVDKEGAVTYSAGNEERINNNHLKWVYFSPITVIKTGEYAKSLLENEYKNMSNEEILAKYKEFKEKNGEGDFFFTVKEDNRQSMKGEMIRARNMKFDIGLPISQGEEDSRNRRETTSRFDGRVDLRDEQRQNETPEQPRARIRGASNINWFGFRIRD